MITKKINNNFLKFISHPLFIAFITVILTLFFNSLYDSWKLKTQILLSAKGTYQSVEIPSLLFSAYKNFRDSIYPDSLEKVVPEIKGLRNDTDMTSISLYSYLNSLQVNNVITDLKYIHSFWTFSIENNGSDKIENLTLFVPFNGYYELTQNEATQSATGKFDKNIDIGNLKPSNSILIKVWSESSIFELKGKPYFSSLEDKPKVTFENGYKLVDFSK